MNKDNMLRFKIFLVILSLLAIFYLVYDFTNSIDDFIIYCNKNNGEYYITQNVTCAIGSDGCEHICYYPNSISYLQYPDWRKK